MATTITANGINFPDGSAGSPSIGGTDTNTGLFTGSDIVGFATGGSERLRIDASGNVNIANDSGKLQLGTGNDLQIYHDGSNSYIKNETGDLYLQCTGGTSDDIIMEATDNIFLKVAGSEAGIYINGDGNVELYYNGNKKAETHTNGFQVTNTGADASLFITAEENRSCEIQFLADEGDDYADYSRIHKNKDTGKLHIQNYAGGSWEDNLVCANDGAVELYYDNDKTLSVEDVRIDVKRRIKINNDGPNSGDGMAIGQWDGSNHRIEGDSNRPMYIASYHSSGIKMGISGGVTATVTSNGVTFNGDTAAANALDDYEEGTWTPTTPIGAMQTVHGAHYTKIGRMVNVQAYVTMPTSSSSTTSSITGFPFTALGSSHYAIGAAYCQWQGNDHFFIQMSPGSTTAHPHYGLGYGISFATASGKYVLFSMTYYTS